MNKTKDKINKNVHAKHRERLRKLIYTTDFENLSVYQILEYILQMSCMHWEREKREIGDDTVLWPGQLEKWSCHFTEMRNKEFVKKEQELSWRQH